MRRLASWASASRASWSSGWTRWRGWRRRDTTLTATSWSWWPSRSWWRRLAALSGRRARDCSRHNVSWRRRGGPRRRSYTDNRWDGYTSQCELAEERRAQEAELYRQQVRRIHIAMWAGGGEAGPGGGATQTTGEMDTHRNVSWRRRGGPRRRSYTDNRWDGYTSQCELAEERRAQEAELHRQQVRRIHIAMWAGGGEAGPGGGATQTTGETDTHRNVSWRRRGGPRRRSYTDNRWDGYTSQCELAEERRAQEAELHRQQVRWIHIAMWASGGEVPQEAELHRQQVRQIHIAMWAGGGEAGPGGGATQTTGEMDTHRNVSWRRRGGPRRRSYTDNRWDRYTLQCELAEERRAQEAELHRQQVRQIHIAMWAGGGEAGPGGGATQTTGETHGTSPVQCTYQLSICKWKIVLEIVLGYLSLHVSISSFALPLLGLPLSASIPPTSFKCHLTSCRVSPCPTPSHILSVSPAYLPLPLSRPTYPIAP